MHPDGAKDASLLPLITFAEMASQKQVYSVAQIQQHFKIMLKNYRKGTESLMVPCSRVQYNVPVPMTPAVAAETLCPARLSDVKIEQVINEEMDAYNLPAIVI